MSGQRSERRYRVTIWAGNVIVDAESPDAALLEAIQAFAEDPGLLSAEWVTPDEENNDVGRAASRSFARSVRR